MGALIDTALALLETTQDCVADCALYPRRFTYIGRPVIDCDSIAVSIGDSTTIGITNQCSVQQTQFGIWLARCCWPTVKEDGSPPTPEEINTAVACLMDDVERVLCCLQTISLEGPGIVGRCRPKVTGTRNTNPSGGCAAVEIQLTIETKVCCADA